MAILHPLLTVLYKNPLQEQTGRNRYKLVEPITDSTLQEPITDVTVEEPVTN